MIDNKRTRLVTELVDRAVEFARGEHGDLTPDAQLGQAMLYLRLAMLRITSMPVEE